MQHKIVAVVAIGKNRELGNADKLLWHIPDDMKRFKRLTLGHPIIIGRKTFESIVGYLGKPLPGRTNIVVTRDPDYAQGLEARGMSGVLVTGSFDEALGVARELPFTGEIHIGGGARVYEQALPHIDRLHLTLVDDAPEADTFFPEYEAAFPSRVYEEKREHQGLVYTWLDLERRRP